MKQVYEAYPCPINDRIKLLQIVRETLAGYQGISNDSPMIGVYLTLWVQDSIARVRLVHL